jgi:hypothetical protein
VYLPPPKGFLHSSASLTKPNEYPLWSSFYDEICEAVNQAIFAKDFAAFEKNPDTPGEVPGFECVWPPGLSWGVTAIRSLSERPPRSLRHTAGRAARRGGLTVPRGSYG